MGDSEPPSAAPAADRHARRAPHRGPAATGGSPWLDVSIIIVAARKTAYLMEALAAIANLKRPPRETIVVLDEAHSGGLDSVRCIVSGPIGPAEKRDMGAAAATGEWLAFLDDDGRVSRCRLARSGRAVADGEGAAVAAVRQPEGVGGRWPRRHPSERQLSRTGIRVDLCVMDRGGPLAQRGRAGGLRGQGLRVRPRALPLCAGPEPSGGRPSVDEPDGAPLGVSGRWWVRQCVLSGGGSGRAARSCAWSSCTAVELSATSPARSSITIDGP